MITELDRDSVQLSPPLAGNTKDSTTRLLPTSGGRQLGVPSGGMAAEVVGAHGARSTAPACATTPKLSDLGVLYGGRDRLLRVAEVAEHLGVSTATVYKLCEVGALPHVRIVDSIRVRPSDLAVFVDVQLAERQSPGRHGS
jgi:excisionase family DNA binding protein